MSDPAPPGLLRRLVAMLYDTLLLLGCAMVLTLLFVALRGGQAIASDEWWFRLFLLAVISGFFGWFWTHGGQTPGMVAWRLRVLRNDGQPLRPLDVLWRMLAALLSALPAGLGYLWVLFDRRNRLAWHDRLSRTHLVTVPRPF